MYRTITIILFFVSLNISGQLYPLSDFYSRNPLAVNPAYSGSSDALDITFLYRHSLSGFEGSPKTLSLALHTPFFNEKAGLGFFVLNDRIGVTAENCIIGNYAYRIELRRGSLSLGLGCGMIFHSTQ